jgi:hypothetical protein
MGQNTNFNKKRLKTNQTKAKPENQKKSSTGLLNQTCRGFCK